MSKYDFETWKEVQENEVEYWYIRLFCELRNVANADAHIGNWKNVKDTIRGNTYDVDVKEEFTYEEEKWIDEICVRIKPYFEKWLEKLVNDTEIDYSDYVETFWD